MSSQTTRPGESSLPSSGFIQLPDQVILKILTYLSQNDVKSMMLTHRLFLQIGRVRLYRNILVTDDYDTYSPKYEIIYARIKNNFDEHMKRFYSEYSHQLDYTTVDEKILNRTIISSFQLLEFLPGCKYLDLIKNISFDGNMKNVKNVNFKILGFDNSENDDEKKSSTLNTLIN